MAKLSPSDEADLVLLAILFFFLVLYSSAVPDEGQNAERRNETPQSLASAASGKLFGVLCIKTV